MNTYRLHTLSNGLRVLYLPVESAIGVHVSLNGKVGRRAELDHEAGAAHFLEHLFFDGTEKYPTAFALSEYIDSYGAIRNGVTSPEMVEYWCKILPENKEIAFAYISDIVMHSKLEEIEKERKVIKQEALMNRDNIDRALPRWHKGLIYPNQSLGRTIFEEEDNLPNMQYDLLINYMKRCYHTGNFVLTVSGAISEEDAVALAEKYFADMPSGEALTFDPATIPQEKKINIIQQDLAQSHFALSYPAHALSTFESLYARLVGIILGGGSSARLSNRLRNELHLIYSVFATPAEFSDSGYLQIVTSLVEENLQKALDATKHEIELLVKEGITEAELAKAKNVLLSRTFFRLEDLAQYSTFHNQQLVLTGSILTKDDWARIISNATIEDVMGVAREMFSHEPKLTVMTKNKINLTY